VLSLNGDIAIDLHEEKFKAAWRCVYSMNTASTKDTHEFEALTRMHRTLQACPTIEKSYKVFLEKCFEVLKRFDSSDSSGATLTLRSVMEDCLVEEPLYFHSDNYGKVYELLRPLQHAYCDEVLIDVTALPPALSSPRRFRTTFDRQAPKDLEFGILVPEGPPSSWGPGKEARRPLTSEVVQSLEKPEARVCVIAPRNSRSSKASYIYDRVRSALREHGVSLLRENKKG